MADRETAPSRSPEKDDEEDPEMEQEDEQEALYEVERVIGKSKIKGKMMYKVRWKGYGPEEDTWEPIENLESCLDLVEEYTQRQTEIAKKRAEERKKKKAQERHEQESEESSEDCQGPYPATFKNSFWKDLEAGRINVFDNDMYSKVKGRATKPTNLREPGNSASSSENEKSEFLKKRHSSDPEKPSEKVASRNASKSKSTVKVKDKYSKSHSKGGSVKSSARKIDFKCVITTSSESESDSEMMDIRKSCPLSVNTDTEKDKDVESLTDRMDQNSLLKTPERNSTLTLESPNTSSAKTINYSLMENESEELPITPDMSNVTKDTSSSSSTRTTNYSLLERFEKEDNILAAAGDLDEQCEDPLVTKISDREAEKLHTESSSKKKKKKKHSSKHRHKHKKDRGHGSSPLFKVENLCTSELKQKERKRKLSQSSEASSAVSEASRSFKMPKLELEVSESNITKIKIRTVHSDLKTDGRGVGNENNRNSFNVSDNLISRSHSLEKLNSIETSSSPIITLSSEENNSHSGNKTPQSVNKQTVVSQVNACGNSVKSSKQERSKTPQPVNKQNMVSEVNTSGKSVKSLKQETNVNSDCNVSENNSSSHLNTSATGRLERMNSEVEQADSGIASPASEEGTVASRKLFGTILDDILGRTDLSLLSDVEKTSGLDCDQELEIELDDIDLDLFEQEVKLEPIFLTDREFAEAVKAGDYELVKRAFRGEGKYDLECPDVRGKTLLMMAAEKAYDDLADLLIQNGAKLNAQMHNGTTALMLACEHAEICTVNLLLEHGAKVNLQSETGESALMMAGKRGHKQMIWLLLECGANFNQQSLLGHTALSYVKHLHHWDSESIMTGHIDRVMLEFNKQVAITLNNTADIIESLFPAQLLNICEDEKFEVKFEKTVTESVAGVGNLLFIGHAMFANHEVKCRFYGPCAVKSVFLNGHRQSSLTEEANFVLAFGPLVNGRNVLTINTVNAPGVKAKLIVCAYRARLINS